jgi:hypothetical protein
VNDERGERLVDSSMDLETKATPGLASHRETSRGGSMAPAALGGVRFTLGFGVAGSGALVSADARGDGGRSRSSARSLSNSTFGIVATNRRAPRLKLGAHACRARAGSRVTKSHLVRIRRHEL